MTGTVEAITTGSSNLLVVRLDVFWSYAMTAQEIVKLIKF